MQAALFAAQGQGDSKCHVTWFSTAGDEQQEPLQKHSLRESEEEALRGVRELAEHLRLVAVAQLLVGHVVVDHLVAAGSEGALVVTHAVGLGVVVDLDQHRGEVDQLRHQLVQKQTGVSDGLAERRDEGEFREEAGDFIGVKNEWLRKMGIAKYTSFEPFVVGRVVSMLQTEKGM